MKINVANIIKDSVVDGPGIRTVVFFQGCIHNCRGCHNQSTHDFLPRNIYTTPKLLAKIEEENPMKLVTFSGGEPFCQSHAVSILAKKLVERDYHIMLYTGFVFEYLQDESKKNSRIDEIIHNIDILVDGKFIIEQRDLSLKFRGSKNQRVIDVKKTLSCGKIVLLEEEQEC